jgi:hypothetical protein
MGIKPHPFSLKHKTMIEGNYKVYEANCLKLIKFVKISGKSIECPFVNGIRTPLPIGGRYGTRFIEIQECLEKSPDFGKKFKLISTEEPKKEETEETKIQITPIGGITNGQQAKEYIIRNYPGTTFRVLANKQMILQFAKEHNIEFTDWPVD